MTNRILDLLGGKPRLLALGEPTHGEDDLLRVRNDLFRELVERHGYRCVALESDCLRGLRVDDYVTGGGGELDEVLAGGFSHGFGEAAGNRELVAWLREHNDGLPPERKVRFAGFDGPLEITGAESPREAMLRCADDERTAATIDRLIGADARWTNPAAMRDASASVGRSAEADQLRLLADDLVTLAEMRPGNHRRLYARSAAGLLRYHRIMADPGPGRLGRMLGQRAAMMSANLTALAERGPVLAYAHNAHLQRERSSMRMDVGPVHWWSAGAMIGDRWGGDYRFVAMAVGTIRHRGVGTPPPDTVEGVLQDRPDGVVDPGDLGPGLVKRESPWFGYAPLDPAQLSGIDAIVYVRDVGGSAPVARRAGR